jgi:hypothetical protein
MEQFGVWLATSPIAGALKAASGAVLVWVLDNIASFGLPAVVQVAIVAGLPVLINSINPQDPRYGFQKESEGVSD